MKQDEIKEILTKHAKWLKGEEGGERADLRGEDLSGANLEGANLSDAKLNDANLSDAKLTDANLSLTDLRDANLRDANLRGADLSYAKLRGADLRGAKLIVLNSEYYTAYIQKTHTRIGCKYYSNDEWMSFTDEQISEMDEYALAYWTKYRKTVLAEIESLNSEGEN